MMAEQRMRVESMRNIFFANWKPHPRREECLKQLSLPDSFDPDPRSADISIRPAVYIDPIKAAERRKKYKLCLEGALPPQMEIPHGRPPMPKPAQEIGYYPRIKSKYIVVKKWDAGEKLVADNDGRMIPEKDLVPKVGDIIELEPAKKIFFFNKIVFAHDYKITVGSGNTSDILIPADAVEKITTPVSPVTPVTGEKEEPKSSEPTKKDLLSDRNLLIGAAIIAVVGYLYFRKK